MAFSDGRYVVAWDAHSNTSNQSYYRFFDYDGTPLGPTQSAADEVANGGRRLALAALPNDEFALIWEVYPGYKSFFRVFDAQGNATGDIEVSSSPSQQETPAITRPANGNLVVGWSADDDIRIRIFNPDGSVVSTEIITSTITAGVQQSVMLLALDDADGGFVVGWAGVDSAGGDYGGFVRTYDSDGMPREPTETRINDRLEGMQYPMGMTLLSDGRFVASFTGKGDEDTDGVYFRIYDPADMANPSEVIRINVQIDGRQNQPDVIALTDGFAIAYNSDGWPNDYQVAIRLFDNDGTARQSIDVPVPNVADGIEYQPQIVALDDGGLAVSWMGGVAGAQQLFVSIFNADGSARYEESFDVSNAGSMVSSHTLMVLADGGLALSWVESDGMHSRVLHLNPDAPVAENAQAQALEDDVQVIDTAAFGFADINGDAFVSVTITELPDHGVLKLNGTVITASMVSAGTAVISKADLDAGKLNWMPDADFNGSITVKFRLLDDGDITGQWGGENLSTEQSMTLTTLAINDGVEGADGTVTATEDVAYVFTLADFPITDTADGDALAAVIITQLPANGHLKFNGIAVAVNQAISTADIAAGKLTWLPVADANGAGLATLEFKVQDDGGTANGGVDTSATAYTLTLNVAAANDAPVLGFVSASTFENAPLTMAVLGGASDVDGDTLTLLSAKLASGFGAVSVDGGRVIYDPTKAPNQNIDAGESRTVTVNYTISDGHGGVVTQTITITVNGVAPQVFTGTDRADRLSGSDGGDEMRGGRGNDTYIVNDVLDVVIEGKKGGRDLVQASVDCTLGNNVENLTLTGEASIRGNGNALDNDIIGNAGDNVLWGGRGTDRLTGGEGADTFLFTSAAESRRGASSDHILDFSSAEGDIIDLVTIDANVNRKGDQAFLFIGNDDFRGRAGELRFERSAGDVVVLGDTDGDSKADFQIVLDGLKAVGREDFLL